MQKKLTIYILLAGIMLLPSLAEQAAARPLAEASYVSPPVKPAKKTRTKRNKRSKKFTKPQKQQFTTLFINLTLIIIGLLAAWAAFGIGVQLLIPWLWYLGLIIALLGMAFLLAFFLFIYADITPPSENDGFGGAILALTLLVLMFSNGIAGVTYLVWGLIIMNSLLWIMGSIALFSVILPLILIIIYNEMN